MQTVVNNTHKVKKGKKLGKAHMHMHAHACRRTQAHNAQRMCPVADVRERI